jgi:hypothetical protein
MAVNPTRFLTQAVVRLFGWKVGQVTWTAPAAAAGPSTATLAATAPAISGEQSKALEARILAHVLAFTTEGRYTPFRAPALFLVPNDGEWVWDDNGKIDPARLGLAQLDNTTLFAPGLQFWVCDRSDYITRLDMSNGTLQRVVIDLETSGAQGRRIDLVGQEGSYTARLGQGHH